MRFKQILTISAALSATLAFTAAAQAAVARRPALAQQVLPPPQPPT
jgi:hypothetical protein